MQYLREHLGARIVLLFIAMMAVFGLLMGLYIRANNQKLRDSQTNHLTIRGGEIARGLASNLNLVFAILSFDKKAIDIEYDQGYASSGLAYFIVYNEYSKPIAARYRGTITEASFDFAPPGAAGCDRLTTATIRSRDGEPFIDLAMPVRVTHKSLVPVGEDDACIGWVRVGLSLAAISREVNRAAWEGVGLIALVMLFGAVIISISLYWVLPPLNRLTRATHAIGKGTLDATVEVTSNDEIGLLARTFNAMAENLRRQQQDREQLMDAIVEAVNLIGGSSSQILAVSIQQAEGAASQATIIEELGASVTETSATADQIAGQARSVSEDAARTAQFCEQGKDFMEQTLGDISQLKTQSEKMAAHGDDLRKQARTIGGVIGIIQEIGGQIGLLALNAQIEAAAAGSHGRRFGVVALEVKGLAARSLESAESVRALVASLQQSMGSIVELMEQEQTVVERASQSVLRLGEYFREILEKIGSTTDASRTIEIITSQQASATAQMVSSIKEVDTITREVLAGVKQIESAMGELKDMAENLSGIILDDPSLNSD